MIGSTAQWGALGLIPRKVRSCIGSGGRLPAAAHGHRPDGRGAHGRRGARVQPSCGRRWMHGTPGPGDWVRRNRGRRPIPAGLQVVVDRQFGHRCSVASSRTTAETSSIGWLMIPSAPARTMDRPSSATDSLTSTSIVASSRPHGPAARALGRRVPRLRTASALSSTTTPAENAEARFGVRCGRSISRPAQREEPPLLIRRGEMGPTWGQDGPVRIIIPTLQSPRTGVTRAQRAAPATARPTVASDPQ